MDSHHINLPIHTDAINTCILAPNGLTLFSASSDQSVKLWSIAENVELDSWEFNDWMHSVTFSANGQMLASAPMNFWGTNKVMLWSIAKTAPIGFLTHDGIVFAAAPSHQTAEHSPLQSATRKELINYTGGLLKG